MFILHSNETRNFEILPFVLHGYQMPQNIAIPAIPFSPHNFKILPTCQMEFLWVCNIFLEIGRNYVSVIITIISSITVLVLHYVICFGYFISMSHGVNKKAPPIVSPRPSYLLGFHQVCLLFYNKYFINPFLL